MTDMITEKQLSFLMRLREERGFADVMTREETSLVFTKAAASKEITRLLAMPKADKVVSAEEAVVEDGYYGVEYEGVLRFYRIKSGKGAYEGRQFVNRYASDYYARTTYVERREVKALIAKDPHTAQMTYAREIGRCYLCGRQLTDEVSRERGVGPYCDSRGRDKASREAESLTLPSV